MTQVAASPATNGELMRRTSVMGSLADKYQVDPNKLLETIKRTCITSGNATMEQIQAFCIVANIYDLNPFLKELYAFPAKGGGIVPVVSIDGWSRIINRTNMVNGVSFAFTGEGKTLACTCTMHVKGREYPTQVTEYWEECARNTEPWKQMPRRMLRHKSLIQCGRVAFSLGGIYDEDEAKDVIRNETGGTTVNAKRIDDLNAAVVAHPTAEGQVIDRSDGYDPAPEDPIIDQEPDAEAPAPDLTSYDGWKSAMQALGKSSNVPEQHIGGAIGKLTLDYKVQVPGPKGDAVRRMAYGAAENGALNWGTGLLVE